EDVGLNVPERGAELLQHSFHPFRVRDQLPVRDMRGLLADQEGLRVPRAALPSTGDASHLFAQFLGAETHKLTLGSHADAVKLARAACTRFLPCSTFGLGSGVLPVRHSPPRSLTLLDVLAGGLALFRCHDSPLF